MNRNLVRLMQTALICITWLVCTIIFCEYAFGSKSILYTLLLK